MMAFLLFLIVFVITYNNGTARTVTNNDIEIVARNGINDESDGLFKLPTNMRPEMTIIINGKLNTTDKKFQIVLRGETKSDEICKLNFNYESETVKINATSEGGYFETEDYRLDLYNQDEKLTDYNFSLSIKGRENQMLAFVFEVNELGPISLFCVIKKFNNIKYIEMWEGITHIDSLLFQFQKNH